MISDPLSCIRSVLTKTAVFFTAAFSLPASSLFLGFNTVTPVQVYSLNGSYLQDVGPAGAIATFPGGSGGYYSVTANASTQTSSVAEYNSNWSPVATKFSVNSLITDGGIYGNDLLLSGYDGTVYTLGGTGTILHSWSTGYSHVGVTSNGASIFTTEGDSGNLIDIWSSTGVSTGHIATPIVGLYGLGYDSTTGDFWASSTDFVYELSPTGNLLMTLNIPGDSRTPNGVVHDSLELGDLGPAPVTTPEPGSMLLILSGLVLLAIQVVRSRGRKVAAVISCLAGGAGACFGSVTVHLTTSVPSGAPVGTTVNLVASASDSTNSKASFTYQFSTGPAGGPLQVRRDFYTFNSFLWTPTESEGSYELEVVVHSSTGATGMATEIFTVDSRITGSSPVITPTANPLVALYSLPVCPAGRTARVRFKLPSDPVWQFTPAKSCTGDTSLNFYLAGMQASTTYQVQQDVFNGPFATVGPMLSLKTGALPANLPIPQYTTVKASPAPNSTAYPVLLMGPVGTVPYATDINGHLIWYLQFQNAFVNYLLRPLPGGTLYTIGSDGLGNSDRIFREYDLAGNIVRETNSTAIAARLTALHTDPITSIHHDAILLPNGDIAFLGSVEKVANQGAGTVDVIGDEVVVVDPRDFSVKFSWDEFNHLDIKRRAVLGEICLQGTGGCPHLVNPNYKMANDWTHSNALTYDPVDHNLLVSIRHQDWVIKFRYDDGAGDGTILWRLGNEGDFKISSAVGTVNYPWFSHQHNIETGANGTLSLFDNGNTRVRTVRGNSRGQVLKLDESSRVATLTVNLDLGAYSTATGSAQALSNGNYTFDLGFIGTNTSVREFTSSNAVAAQVDSPKNSYRSYRMHSLYSENRGY